VISAHVQEFLPDGRHFLFASDNGAERTGFISRRFDGGAQARHARQFAA
jgi:hypothetical protein